MEIIIGRDQQTRKLNIIKEGKTYLYGQEGFVPMNVICSYECKSTTYFFAVT